VVQAFNFMENDQISEQRGKRMRPTGVGTAGPGLTDDLKEHLRTIAGSKAPPAADLDAFVKLVDMAVSQ
jgi:hypothetical protein